MGQFSISRQTRQVSLGAAAALALILGSGTGACADSPPKIDHSYPTAQPNYPDSAQLNGETGDVLIDVFVSSSGKPRKLRVHQSSGFADLDNAAAEAIAGWHYIPAIQNGDTTSDWVTVKIHFQPPQAPAQATPANATTPAQH